MNKTVIVTGGTRGIGACITKEFLEDGAQVIATYFSNSEKAKNFKNELSADLAKNLTICNLDVSSSFHVDDFFASLKSICETFHILVNNAGIRKDNLLYSLSEEDWDSVMDTNSKGAYLMSKKSLDFFVPQKFGRIINMGSLGGEICFPGQSNYAASKAALKAMTKSLAKEVAKKGITVNCIAPGFIETDLISSLPSEQLMEYKKTIPMKRFGKPEEVAHAVKFLCSENASYITGETLTIGGGL